MPTAVPLGPRQAAFAEFVRSAIRRAAPATVPEIATRAEVGKTTIYRWRDGQWTDDPSPAQVKRFCLAIGIKPDEAFRVLWLDDGRRSEPGPADDPDVREILRALRSDELTQAERFHARETLRSLADRYRQSSRRPRQTG